MNKLLIKENNVEIETQIVYKAIELNYTGELYIENLLPNDYLVQKGNNKIIIIKFDKREEVLTELFNYDGYCNIHYGYLIDENKQKHTLSIQRPSVLTWNKMGTKKNLSGTETKTDWEYLTTDYQDMKNSGRNDYMKSFKFSRKVDNEAKTKTEIKELSRNLSNKGKKDRNLSTLESLGINIRKTKKATKTRQKIKRGY